MDEGLRKLIDLAVTAGEMRTSLQTGYLHLNNHALKEEVHYTIPVLENLLLILALFRTRSVENMMRAKLLLEKLLLFQAPLGNFPVYLHEYPECKDIYFSLKIIPPLYWILQSFSQVLDISIKMKIEQVLLELSSDALELLTEKNPPFFMQLRIASNAIAVGKLLQVEQLEEKGLSLFNQFEMTKIVEDPKILSDMIVSLQMVGSDLMLQFQSQFWNVLFKTWDSNLSTYLGFFSLQDGYEPEVLLYDLFMGYFTGGFSKRALKDTPIHLQAALIQPLKGFKPLEILKTDQSYNFCINHHLEKVSSFFKLFWGNKARLHTLVIDKGNSQSIEFSNEGNRFQFLFSLSHLPELEDKEKSREVQLFFDLSENCEFKVDGVRATTFQINDTVEVDTDGLKSTLKFEVVKGEGQFLGHFMRGNRPSQIANKGQQRFTAFDWQIFLRTIRRSEECVIRCTLTIVLPISC